PRLGSCRSGHEPCKVPAKFRVRMAFSENRFPLFGVMRGRVATLNMLHRKGQCGERNSALWFGTCLKLHSRRAGSPLLLKARGTPAVPFSCFPEGEMERREAPEGLRDPLRRTLRSAHLRALRRRTPLFA